MSRSEPLRLPAPEGAAPEGAAPARPPARPAARDAGSALDAQIAGATGARRGLREGAAALTRARRAYLAAEWSGEDDRRPAPGLLARHRL